MLTDRELELREIARVAAVKALEYVANTNNIEGRCGCCGWWASGWEGHRYDCAVGNALAIQPETIKSEAEMERLFQEPWVREILEKGVKDYIAANPCSTPEAPNADPTK